MRRPEFIARQSGNPTGLLGRVIARIMRGETVGDNAIAVETLAVKCGDDVLEIGCGHGRTLAHLAKLSSPGLTVGLDHSPVMLDVAASTNADAIALGRIQLRRGECEDLPFGNESFDRVLCVHTAYFWPDAERCLAELARVLRPGGRLVLAHRPGDDDRAREAFPDTVYRFRNRRETTQLLHGCGLPAPEFRMHTVAGRRLETCSVEKPAIDRPPRGARHSAAARKNPPRPTI